MRGRGAYHRTLLAALLAVGVAPTLAVVMVTWLLLATTQDVGRALPVIVTVGLAMTLAAGAFAWRLAAALAHPLGRLRDGAALMRGPNPSHRIAPPPGAADELAEIGRALDTLADRALVSPAGAAVVAGIATTDATFTDERAAGQQALSLLGDDGLFAPAVPAFGPGAAAGSAAGSGPASAGSRRLADLSFAVLDLETTGLDPAGGDRVVSVAVVRVRGGQVAPAERFSTLVDPGRPIPPASTAIHGITDAMLQGAPSLAEVAPDLVAFVGECPLVGHVVTFDLAFLEPALREAGLPSLRRNGVLDTLLLGHALLPTFRAASLDELAGLLGVVVQDRHTALGDALTTAGALVRLLGLLEQRGAETLDAALALQRPSALREALGGLLGGR